MAGWGFGSGWVNSNMKPRRFFSRDRKSDGRTTDQFEDRSGSANPGAEYKRGNRVGRKKSKEEVFMNPYPADYIIKRLVIPFGTIFLLAIGIGFCVWYT